MTRYTFDLDFIQRTIRSHKPNGITPGREGCLCGWEAPSRGGLDLGMNYADHLADTFATIARGVTEGALQVNLDGTVGLTARSVAAIDLCKKIAAHLTEAGVDWSGSDAA